MEYLFIYCLQLADVIGYVKFTVILLTTLTGIVIVAHFLSSCDAEEEIKPFKKAIKYFSIISIVLAVIPTKNTLLLLGGTYYGKKAVKQVVTSEKLQKIDTIINLELDKRIKELKNAR